VNIALRLSYDGVLSSYAKQLGWCMRKDFFSTTQTDQVTQQNGVYCEMESNRQTQSVIKMQRFLMLKFVSGATGF